MTNETGAFAVVAAAAVAVAAAAAGLFNWLDIMQ
jgi:hypothetical protein